MTKPPLLSEARLPGVPTSKIPPFDEITKFFLLIRIKGIKKMAPSNEDANVKQLVNMRIKEKLLFALMDSNH